jgi:threonine dehydratase
MLQGKESSSPSIVLEPKRDCRLKLERIEEAARVIDPVFLNSPQYRAEALESVLGCRLVVKVETLNPIRCFKGRGASYFVSGLSEGAALVCASAGNFGQAMAYACRSKGIRIIVYASVKASPLKIERMRMLGAEVRLHGEDFDAAKLEAKRFACESTLRMVEDSLDVATCEGAGTMGIELLRWLEPFDAILVALGNGAMLTGVGRWVKSQAPQTQMIGVAAVGAPAMAESWRTGRIIEHARIETIADGIGVRVPVPEAVADMHGSVDDVLLVGDDTILKAMKLIHEHLGLVVEPSGAAGVAAILENRERFKDQTVAAILCGGNLTPQQIAQWLI